MNSRPEKPSNEGKRYFRLGEAAKRLGISQDKLRTLADRGKIPFRWKGPERVFPVSSTEALALEKGIGRDDDVDALALGMMAEGETDERIVTLLRIPLERLERLHEVRDGRKPGVAKAEPSSDRDDEKSRAAIEARLAAGRAMDDQRQSERRRRMLRGRRISA